MAEDGSLDFRLVQRVCQLQQALDQALDSLTGLKQRLQNQQLIEQQLAQTERYANVQRQLIVHFQQQAAQQSHWQARLLQDLLHQGEHTFDQQRVAMEQLRSRLQQGHAALQDYLLNLGQFGPPPQPCSAGPGIALEAEVRVARLLSLTLSRQIQAAHSHLQQLETGLSDYQALLLSLQAALAVAVEDRAETPDLDLPVEDTAAHLAESQQSQQLQQWRYRVRSQQHRIEQLEGELNQQYQVQARLQHQCQAVSAQRDYYQQQFALAQQHNAQLRSQLSSVALTPAPGTSPSPGLPTEGTPLASGAASG